MNTYKFPKWSNDNFVLQTFSTQGWDVQLYGILCEKRECNINSKTSFTLNKWSVDSDNSDVLSSGWCVVLFCKKTTQYTPLLFGLSLSQCELYKKFRERNEKIYLGSVWPVKVLPNYTKVAISVLNACAGNSTKKNIGCLPSIRWDILLVHQLTFRLRWFC